jgi:hypothetical protein
MGIKILLNPMMVMNHEKEILEWCENNNIIVDRAYLPDGVSIFEPDFYTFYFANYEDAMAFKLKWR